ncbi:MAG: class I SAM-dependent methyltransferase [Deltaproteobacteria bacterium]|nr:class I SAM-dependent methyltransferase [Deltaproteobacteria bacterium]MBW2342133.1 class I SAM-dependent methyltransferase [Deltaproteobacteria bacterium]
MREQKEQYWGKFALTYDNDQEYIVGKPILQAITTKLHEECDLGEVIEFGCGAGYFTKVIAEKARHIIATDLSDRMLEVARVQLQKFQNITIQKANCEDTYFPSRSFDSVFMANLVHVVENPMNVFQESHQILKNGGLLLIVDFTGYGMNWFERMKLGIRYLKKLGMPPRHSRNKLSPDQLVSFVETIDFKVEEARLLGDKTKALYLRGRKA